VSNTASNSVTEIQASTGSVVNTIPVGGSPAGISSDGTDVWVDEGLHNVAELVTYSAPKAPKLVSSKIPDDGSIDNFSWSPPASDGGSAITGYSVQTSTDGTTWYTVPRLIPATTYGADLGAASSFYFRVAAVNGVGIGCYSTPIVVNRQVPGPPISVAGTTPNDGQTEVISWSKPYSDGGSAITSYVVESFSDSSSNWSAPKSVVGTTFSIDLGAAANLYFRVAAVNALGAGVFSDPIQVQRSAPDAPTLHAITITNNGADEVFPWSPSNDGGAAIVSYLVETSSDGQNWHSTTVNGTSYTISLGISQSFFVKVAAVNIIGTSSFADFGEVSGLKSQLPLVISNRVHSVAANEQIHLESSGGSGKVAPFYNASGSGCEIDGPILTVSRPTICLVTVTNPANGSYSAATSEPVSFQFTGVAQKPISVNGGMSKVSRSTTFQLTSDGGSGSGHIVYVSRSPNCLVLGSVLHLLNGSECVVVAEKVASGFYKASQSSPETVTFRLEIQAPLQLTFSYIKPIGSSEAVRLSLHGGSGVGNVVFVVSNSAGSKSLCQHNGTIVWATQSTTCFVYATKAASGAYSEQQSFKISIHIYVVRPMPPNSRIYCFRGSSELVRIGTHATCPAGYLRSSLRPPSRPRALEVSAISGGAILTWAPPASFGGSSWVGYTALAEAPEGSLAGFCVSTAKTRCRIMKLHPGVVYRFTVVAWNGLGIAGESAASLPVSKKVFGNSQSGSGGSTPVTQPGNSNQDALQNWYASFSNVLTNLNALVASYNITVNDFGYGNAWTWTMIDRWNTIAGQIESPLAPYSPSIQQAQLNLAADIQTFACLGETFEGASCPGVYEGWIGYGPQQSETVAQDIINLSSAIQNSGL